MDSVSIRFPSGDTTCAASHYPASGGGCVVMAPGFGVTKEVGCDRYARAFNDAGFNVLTFDYRHLGQSGGTPRQIAPIRGQLADWDAALACARTLDGVDPARIAAWGFSVSGGHVLRVAAKHPDLAAAIAQTPNVDGPAATRNAARYQQIGPLLRFSDIAMLDMIGGITGRKPRLVPLTGPRGTVAMLTTPDVADGQRALDPDGIHTDWQQEIAARSALRVGFYRPARAAKRVRCPLLVVVAEDDRSALAAPAVRTAERAPLGELVTVPGGHYAPFLDAHDEVVARETAFLLRHLAVSPRMSV